MPSILKKILAFYEKDTHVLDETDGASLDLGNWRMNIRASNTEPLLRLNVESHEDEKLVWNKVKEIESLIS